MAAKMCFPETSPILRKKVLKTSTNAQKWYGLSNLWKICKMEIFY
jgi:hypothetical protein